MNRFLLTLVLVCISAAAFSQGKDGIIKVRKKENTMPMIAGVAGGEIDGALLCSGEGIVINSKLKVVSFVFITDTGDDEVTMKLNGNKLNKEACDIIGLLRSGAEIYFNEIAVVDEKGRESLATPIRLKLK